MNQQQENTKVAQWKEKRLKKTLSKNGSLGWHPGPGNLGQKGENMPPLWCHPKKTQNKKNFTGRPTESVMGLNNSLAQGSGTFLPKGAMKPT